MERSIESLEAIIDQLSDYNEQLQNEKAELIIENFELHKKLEAKDSEVA